MLKAYPRAWVDLTTAEIFSVLAQLLNPKKAAGSDGVSRFEEAFAEFIGVEGAVAFPQCRSGLYFSLLALDLEPGSEVIIPAFGFYVDPAMVVLAGHKPVFVDVDFETANLDPAKIEAAITERTRVIMPTHLNGLPCEMGPIMELARKHNLRVVEDCARACGAHYQDRRVGSFDVGAFSFGYGKSFYGFGGSMVTSSDRDFLGRLRQLQSQHFQAITSPALLKQTLKGCLLKYLDTPSLHGLSLFHMAYKYQVEGNKRWAPWFRFTMLPYETIHPAMIVKMNNIQARMGLRQLKRIDRTNAIRRQHLKLLNQELSGLNGLGRPADPDDREHVSVHYAIWSERKQDLQVHMLNNRIDTQDDSAEDLTCLDRFKPYLSGPYPNANKLRDRLIFLPTHPCLGRRDILYIAGQVKRFFTS